ncbi:MAG: TadE/TadG family type IV pilus assembly protein [Acetobacteraceae bacterium]|jgi:Flp pilus assembly protein TadG
MAGLAQLATAIRAVRHNRRGIAATEFALIAPVMLTLLLGVYDVGNAIQERLQLEQAVRAGAQYALSWPDQTSGISAAISAALPPSWTSPTVTVSAPACWCWSSGGGATSTPCSATCAEGSTKRSYVTLTATNNATPFLFSAIAGNSATYVVRFQ